MVIFSSHDHDLFEDSRGTLGYMEFKKQIPFISKRLFFMFGMPEGATRGGHAHRNCQQYLFIVKGQVRVTCKTKSHNTSVLLNKPDKGIFIDSKIWCELSDFTNDTIIVVLASEEFNEDDYIRDWDQFLNYV